MRNILLICVVFVISGCSQLKIKTVHSMNHKSDSKTDEPDFAKPDEAIIDQKSQVRYNNVALLLGPGLAKTMSYIPFLKELDNYNLNIKLVAGLGWGSVAGAIYAQNLKKNELDWQFYKLSQLNILKKNIFGKKLNEIDFKLQKKYFYQVFGKNKIENFKVPFICPYLSTEEQKIYDIGLVYEGLAKCIESTIQSENEGIYLENLKGIINYFTLADINTIVIVNSTTDVESVFNTNKEVKSIVEAMNIAPEVKFFSINLNSNFIPDVLNFKYKKNKIIADKKLLSNQVKSLVHSINKIK